MANVITVTALNRYVKSLLESDAVLTDVAIRGEIQNFVHHLKSGHFYFSLKDADCSVKAVMFRANASRLSFVPENGMSVVVRCRISLYERDGAFQLYVDELFPDGLGAMQMAFEQLKARLANEGLFANEHKKSLPDWPHRIGLVTSKTGAAVRDIYSVAERRWPLAEFVLYDASVQGREAEQALCRGVELLDQSGLADVIIIARGGGSREDLWVFNSEALARVVYACHTPIVSGIGHEIDFTILDFVADVRAATPTAAAELVLPDSAAIAKQLEQLTILSESAVSKQLNLCYNKLNTLRSDAVLRQPVTLLAQRNKQLEQVTAAAERALTQKISNEQQRLAHVAALLDSLSPLATLARGYCIASKDGLVLQGGSTLCTGDTVSLAFTDADVTCSVLDVTKGTFTDEKIAKF